MWCATIATTRPQVDEAVLSESMHFLGWLADHNFTFLGMREYQFSEIDGEPHLDPIPDSGLGICPTQIYSFCVTAKTMWK